MNSENIKMVVWNDQKSVGIKLLTNLIFLNSFGLEVRELNLPVKLLELAKSQGEKEALVWGHGSLTYAELAKAINQMAAGLQHLGLKLGNRVAIQLLNVPEFVITYFAVIRLGGVVVPINPMYTGRELEFIMSNSGAKALVTSPEKADIIEGIRTNLPEFQHLILTSGEKPQNGILLNDLYLNSETTFPEPDGKDLAEIMYTSGTTGKPKGAMLSHHNLYSNACLVVDDLKLTQEVRTLIVAPLFHIAAQSSFLNSTLVCGGTCYLQERWTKADVTLEALQNYKITYFFGVPTMYVFMLDSPNFAAYDLSFFKIPFTGGASLPAEIFNKWKEITGNEIIEGYGMSETTSACTRNPFFGTKKPGSVGKAYPGIEVKIVDEQGNELPSGQVGEIVVSGPNVMLGYWQNPDATSQTLRNQWLYTGDLAYKDKEDYIFVVDRKKDMIIRGGLKIYPREVEEIIYRYPGVLEAAVVGVPDRVMSEEVKAFITLKSGASIDLEELREFCRQELVYYKVPKYIAVIDNLPKTPSGKIRKKDLRDIS